ncbi:MAG: PilN domain-containing protein [Dokdonella sp.]|uniref:PilN domain-containing protein n=1 Tax=Dokdonella sp. TaxID=2291710 RepID=UPI0025C06BAC|nr:PilN domain-containing protein [Dokdonella sp.]MBZ0223781.1 PilN domain-containing protein [Dokdonella sp.]MCC7254813.1 PilN domain-containing protein [Dokdonella sp.]
MNPTVDRLIARVRTRLAKTPLPRFFAWWGRELLACLPPRWREFLADRSETLLIGREGEALVVWRERGGQISEHGRIDGSQPAEVQTAQFRQLRGAIDDANLRSVYCIDRSRVLARVLSLPAAATDNLTQVLGFEMDRQTPFKADQVYFDSRVIGEDTAGRTAQVELVLMPRAQLDAELAALPAGIAPFDGVDAWSAAPGIARRRVNLLAADKRTQRRDLRLPLNLGLAAAALLLLVLNMDESLANRAATLDAMRVEVDDAAKQAKQVAALRKSLTDSIVGANFLADRKRKGPTVVGLIDDITRRLPLDAYLERLQIENKQVQIQGQATEAAKLIALLGASPCLGNPGFQGQVQPDPRTGKERFQVNAELKECELQPNAGSAVPGKPDQGSKDVAAKAAAAAQVAAKDEKGKMQPEPAKPAPAPAQSAPTPAKPLPAPRNAPNAQGKTAAPPPRERAARKEP